MLDNAQEVVKDKGNKSEAADRLAQEVYTNAAGNEKDLVPNSPEGNSAAWATGARRSNDSSADLTGDALPKFLAAARNGRGCDAKDALNAWLSQLPSRSWGEQMNNINNLLHTTTEPEPNLLWSEGYDSHGARTNKMHVELTSTNKDENKITKLFDETLDKHERKVSDTSYCAMAPLTPAEMSESIIKNKGFSKLYENRHTLETMMLKQLEAGDKSVEQYVNQVNAELSKRGSSLALEGNVLKSVVGTDAEIKWHSDKPSADLKNTIQFVIKDTKSGAKVNDITVDASLTKVYD